MKLHMSSSRGLPSKYVEVSSGKYVTHVFVYLGFDLLRIESFQQLAVTSQRYRSESTGSFSSQFKSWELTNSRKAIQTSGKQCRAAELRNTR